jgi:hypothetical protein
MRAQFYIGGGDSEQLLVRSHSAEDLAKLRDAFRALAEAKAGYASLRALGAEIDGFEDLLLMRRRGKGGRLGSLFGRMLGALNATRRNAELIALQGNMSKPLILWGQNACGWTSCARRVEALIAKSNQPGYQYLNDFVEVSLERSGQTRPIANSGAGW